MSYQQVADGQVHPEVPINENMAALGQAFVFSHDVTADSGLVVGINGGNFDVATVADTTITATDNTTNYVVAHRTTHAVTTATATTNWNNTGTYGRVGRAVFASGVLTWHDERYSAGGIFDHAATLGGGTVTSVAATVPSWLSVSGSPITSSGTLAITAATGQAANQVLATPDGSTGAASLRALVAADVPTLNQNTTGSAATLTTSRNIDGQAFNGSANITVIAPGTHAASSKSTPVDADEMPLADSAASFVLKKLTWLNLKATLKTYFDTLYGSGSGSVTSVAATVPSWLSVSGSPITTSGTLAITAASGQTANQFLATPNGSTGAVGLRAIVAADVPTLNQNTTGSAATLTTARTIGGTSFDGSANITQPFDVQGFYPGVPTASAKVLRVPIARAVTFAANFAGSYFSASANATGSTVFDVQQNGSSIGSITIAAGTTTATFTTTSGTSKTFAAGDVLMIVCPGTPDATLADPGFVLAGTR